MRCSHRRGITSYVRWSADQWDRTAITEAQDWFAQVAGPTTLTADSHYQLANRLASGYKVASVGVPVVLLYLGFTGDTYFGDHVRDAAHWQQLMRGYLQGVVPSNRPVECCRTCLAAR